MHQLLAHLASWPPDGRFQSHTYQKISGGANNILYKVSGEDGDPAFEMVDMMTHPQFMAVPPEQWDWVVALYAKLCGRKRP